MVSNSQAPTLQDVAHLAQTSTATVSRALNSPNKVAKETRDRIEAAIEALGYTPNFGARSLAKNRVDTVGAIIPTLANAMFASGIQAFQEVLSEAGVTLLIGSSAYDPDAEFRQVRNLVTQGASGLLLIGVSRLDKTRKFLETRRVPHVLTWCYHNDDSGLYVGFDNRTAAYDAAMAVLAHNHRKIAMISGRCSNNDRAAQRQLGVCDALRTVTDAEMLSIQEAPYLLRDGADACHKILSRYPEVTAVICGNDVLAAGAMMAARDKGIRVPEDLSIIGFDDIGVASVVSPPLTTVRVPQLDMGRAAAKTLLSLIFNDAQVHSQCFPTKLIMRRSLGPARR